MTPDSPSRLLAGRVALVLAPLVAGVSVVLQPDLGSSGSDRLAAMDSTPAAVSAAAFLVDQLPMLIAILAIGRLLLPDASRLSAWGTALAVLGTFGHTAFGGLSLVLIPMSHDEAHRGVYARLVDEVFDSPIMLVSMVGLIGTVLGLLLLGIGVFRSRTGPIWVGPAIWAFLLVEFVGSGLSPHASYLSVLLLAAAFWGLLPSLTSAHSAAPEPQPVR
jgi:hypothetical protein